jgi:hypothetical protein
VLLCDWEIQRFMSNARAQRGKNQFSTTGAVYGVMCYDVASGENGGPLITVSTSAAGKIVHETFVSTFAHLQAIRNWIFWLENIIG